MSLNTSSKAGVRKRIRQCLKQLSPAEIEEASHNLRDQLEFPPGAAVAIFAGLSNEPQLLDLIEIHPTVNWYLPRITGPGEMDFLRVQNPADLIPGPYGILEPHFGGRASRLDFIICPGVAFTREGHRLGQGGGFYDRALPQFPEARIFGVGFPCQMVARLPVEDHDRLMDRVILPRSDN